MARYSGLKSGQTIRLWGLSDGVPYQRGFEIVRQISRGGCVLCYRASSRESGPGVLKEFCPRGVSGLVRDDMGQLIFRGEDLEARARFQRELERYLAPFRMLLEAKGHGEDDELATFIPPFELFRGAEGTAETVYVWTPGPQLETFAQVCREIHSHPGTEPEHKLVLVLSAVRTLSRCMCALHREGMVHRDINPANFGFPRRGGETLYQALSMFDVDGVCSVFDPPSDVLGTPGYLEPEAGTRPVSNQTDIYAIGATLFHALVVTDEVARSGYRYQAAYFDRLDELVNQSRLIQASESNAHPRLRHYLSDILKRCLCRREERYPGCEDLLEDLDEALRWALPARLAREVRAGERWSLSEAEGFLDPAGEKNAARRIQHHLYRHPLYRACPGEPGTVLSVLIVGFGHYGQTFLDVCLQAGQLGDKELRVAVVSGDELDWRLYLRDRPALGDFFQIDSVNSRWPESYGVLAFHGADLAFGEGEDSLPAPLEECLARAEGRPRYSFIALGEDGLNLRVARALRSRLSGLDPGCCISYAWEGEEAPSGGAGLWPVRMGAWAASTELEAQLERVAFNAHLVWEKDLEPDYREARARFRKPYNHASSLAFALSVKSKLYSIGIDLDACGPQAAAARFSSRYQIPQIRERLIWLEHRRWVTEKLCAGWRELERLEDCPSGDTKDQKRKRHVCLVPSSPNGGLEEAFGSGGIKQWDMAGGEELARLDPLDARSVGMHREYVRRARAARAQNLLDGPQISALRQVVQADGAAAAALEEWLSCLREVWNGAREKVRLYHGLTKRFLNAAQVLSQEQYASVKNQVQAFQALFAPVLASMEYRDFKQDDVALIRSIPFLLTYRPTLTLAIPYTPGSGAERFANVAAATVVDPGRLVYLCQVRRREDLDELGCTLPCLAAYLKRRRLRAVVELVVLECGLPGEAGRGLEARWKAVTGGRIRKIRRLTADEPEEFPVLVKGLLAQWDGPGALAVEQNQSPLSRMLELRGGYDGVPHYQLDPGTMCFRCTPDCVAFQAAPRRGHLRVPDLMALWGWRGGGGRRPEFYSDYHILWGMYREAPAVWAELCAQLRVQADRSDILAVLERPDADERTVALRMLLPAACRAGAEQVLYLLRSGGLAWAEGEVRGIASDACEVAVVVRACHETVLRRLFSKPYALTDPCAIRLHEVGGGRIAVSFDNLAVKGLRLVGTARAELEGLLARLAHLGYVNGLTVGQAGLSFTYATRRIKDLLTREERILELYTYHKVQASGQFDDMACGLSQQGEGECCVLTRGFSCLLVACRPGAGPRGARVPQLQVRTALGTGGAEAAEVIVQSPEEVDEVEQTLLELLERGALTGNGQGFSSK